MDIGINLAITGTIVLNPPPAVTLAALTLSASTVAEDAIVGATVGTVVGQTTGSTLSLQDDAGGLFALDGLDIEVAGALDFETAESHNITVRETLAGATNTPRDSVIEITVTDVSEGPVEGPELIDNGDMSNDTNWTFSNPGGAGVAEISGGKLRLSDDGGGLQPQATRAVTLTDAATYRVRFTIDAITAGGIDVAVGDGSATYIDTIGAKQLDIVAGAADIVTFTTQFDGAGIVIDDLSVKLLS